ncbi:MAG: L-serine ammonia-lyase, iron-sulfur-dependent, subunit alpha [Clostridia bacterium]|nr:L-serine ammonia-lyase, iron-sulfur-dependent, subunit alpha [Clostridia bacterium]
MNSIKEIYKIGRGPSSSHTMGPERACLYMLEKYRAANCFEVTLYGSLAKTGYGHRTDYAITQTFGELPCRITRDSVTRDIAHPNTMDISAIRDGVLLGRERIYSVGGGDIRVEGEKERQGEREIYPHSHFTDIADYCSENGLSLAQYVYRFEGEEIKKHLADVWTQMKLTVRAGLAAEGVLPGGLNVKRRAKQLAKAGQRERNLVKKENFYICAYAYAACEENANGERMVTAPTCGASGVLPAVLYYEKQQFGVEKKEIIDALAVAGLFGQVIKTNASVSGAEAGCQAEVGSACSMAAAALSALHGLTVSQTECAAEVAMEHFLGLTCDPVGGLVQIPCIERNAVAALRAYNAASLSEVVYDNRKVSFDLVIDTMYATGRDLSACYRETADGGLAKLYVKNFD